MSLDLAKGRGLMLVLSSPSGVGKTTIAEQLLKVTNNLDVSVSVTTRQPRAGEEDGVAYYFVNEDRFHEMMLQGAFLEYAKVFRHYYGTPKLAVHEKLTKGIDVLFDIDWQGNVQLTEAAREDVVSIFILPPSMQELRSRLYSRASDDSEVIKYRMMQAKSELKRSVNYDYVIVNHTIKDSLRKISVILEAERSKRVRRKEEIERLVQCLLNERCQDTN